jgi:hypothetical protein
VVDADRVTLTDTDPKRVVVTAGPDDSITATIDESARIVEVDGLGD